MDSEGRTIMAKYKLLKDGGVQDTETGSFIPTNDERNNDYQDYKKWLQDGYVADPVDPEPEPTGDELLDGSDQSMIRAIDWLITFFITKGTIKIEDLPTEIMDLYEARQSYFTAAGGIYTEDSKLKKLWKVLIS
jgi:hypothetical protein